MTSLCHDLQALTTDFDAMAEIARDMAPYTTALDERLQLNPFVAAEAKDMSMRVRFAAEQYARFFQNVAPILHDLVQQCSSVVPPPTPPPNPYWYC